MKKTLIAMAALAATGAYAQVSISGNADVAFANKATYGGDAKLFAKTTGVSDGLNSPNRIIITVKEDLGGGLSASFVNEHGISPTNIQDWASRTATPAPMFDGAKVASTTDAQINSDAHRSTSTNRGTYVALDGGFGQVRAGYLVSSLYNTSAQSGYFVGAEQYGALLKDFGMGEAGGSRANGIQITSPQLGMFKLHAQKQYGGERTFSSDASVSGSANTQAYTLNKAERTAFRVDATVDALKASYVRTDYKNAINYASSINTPGSSVFGVAATATAANTVPVDTSVKHDHISAIYTMGPWSATWQYNKASVDKATAGVTGTLTASATSADRELKSNQYGIQYTMGAASFFAITGSGKSTAPLGTSATATGAAAVVNDIKNTQYGVRYNLSKRTMAYFFAGTSKDSVPTAVDKITKGTVNGVGLMHAF
jgi:hypothetical protein